MVHDAYALRAKMPTRTRPLPMHTNLYTPPTRACPPPLRAPLGYVCAISLDTYALYIAVCASHLVWASNYLCPSSAMEIHLTFAYAISTYSINME
jgi:hypothetical protein